MPQVQQLVTFKFIPFEKWKPLLTRKSKAASYQVIINKRNNSKAAIENEGTLESRESVGWALLN